MHLEPINPKSHEIYWCSKCDQTQVDSNNKETGNFFVQFGHIFSPVKKNYEGEYMGVMFALCKECQKS